MNAELDKFMAEVMGWSKVLIYNVWRYAESAEKYINYIDWHPTEDLNQAMMCAEKWQGEHPQNRRVELIKSLTEWECNLYTFSSKDYWTLICDAYGQELSIVVCEAIKHVMEAK